MALRIPEALRALLTEVHPLAPHSLPLPESEGRFLATDAVARVASPPFTNSAMDGYALRAADVAHASDGSPVRLPVASESRAGTDVPLPCNPGEVVRILTGAPLPTGADSVELQENTDGVVSVGATATFRRPVIAGKNIRFEGEDAAVGDVLLAAGARLRPPDIGLLASQGYARVDVHRAPRVAILSTGDELRDLDAPLRPGTIVNSNAYMLEALVRSCGGIPTRLPIAKDDLTHLIGVVRDALDTHDVLLSTGGVSVGDHDHMRAAFEGAGAPVRFWKVAIKPGKPLAVGARPDGRLALGLPGNPVSAMVIFHVFVAPVLRALAGDRTPVLPLIPVRLTQRVSHRVGRTEMLRARLSLGDGQLHATPVTRRGSGALPSLASIDALVALPAETEALEEGAIASALVLGDGPRITGAIERDPDASLATWGAL